MALKKDRYVLVVVAILAVVFAFEYYIIYPKTEALKESIISRYDSLKRYEYFIEVAGATAEEIDASIREMKDIEERLIQESSESLASGALQEVISELTGRAGLQVLIVRPLSPVPADNFSIIPLYFEGNGDIKQIGAFLSYLESSDLLIKIDKIDLNVTNVQNPYSLKYKIQVSGMMKL
jgi:Tfp pilus assembly protein PilO